MTESPALALVPNTPAPLMWRGRAVEAREVSLAVGTEAQRIRGKSDDPLESGFYVMLHSLHYADDGTRVFPFPTVQEMRETTTMREMNKLLFLSVEAAKVNRSDPDDLPPELRPTPDPT